ncbi:hypothetical protein GRAQ_01783 [Rahnella aquatilis CIP 78.65 = ATCC 33071]|uniref:Uncharacterized protein n=1 Tax=Rahnella aquatilis (strain ATCC 33071 / DSM 4594 / JCM 1683 / NBRC 105701 / NCIMB 13365 / CIP 78.65) TaxID=745277 RepID=H2IRS9_RAHAC|nr:hypothetical protein Rahaq2_2745 [Rahnella aquatilis CIP 78.65 = ATCC 33071]KFD06114.1 hypothetical protein GRAQ_01783 [Rahnella aquatilis CIP 78.65 = ATCC 33071]
MKIIMVINMLFFCLSSGCSKNSNQVDVSVHKIEVHAVTDNNDKTNVSIVE